MIIIRKDNISAKDVALDITSIVKDNVNHLITSTNISSAIVNIRAMPYHQMDEMSSPTHLLYETFHGVGGLIEGPSNASVDLDLPAMSGTQERYMYLIKINAQNTSTYAIGEYRYTYMQSTGVWITGDSSEMNALYDRFSLDDECAGDILFDSFQDVPKFTLVGNGKAGTYIPIDNTFPFPFTTPNSMLIHVSQVTYLNRFPNFGFGMYGVSLEGNIFLSTKDFIDDLKIDLGGGFFLFFYDFNTHESEVQSLISAASQTDDKFGLIFYNDSLTYNESVDIRVIAACPLSIPY
jgi:hypothetical protein